MKKKTILLYTILYAALAGLLFCLFRAQGKSLVYQSDGWRQHLRALTYYGKYLRGALRHLFIDRSLTPQTWGPDFGYGSDVLTTLQYYCLGEPLTALAVLVPTARTITLYELLILVRPYLAGLFFCVYAFVRGECRPWPVVSGTLVYSFSGTVLYVGFLHPFFVIPMVWFPLVLAGIERTLPGSADKGAAPAGASASGCALRRYVPFAVSVALAALSSFYFFYMLAVFTAAYGIARLLQVYGNAGHRGGRLIATVLREGVKLLGAAFVGVLCAGITLMPVLVQYADDPRAAITHEAGLFYSADYYRQLIPNLVSWINHPQMDTELCFALTFVPLAVFLIVRRGHRTLKLSLALTSLLLLFPAAGKLLNGGSYVINRWTWVTGMLAGWITVRASAGLVRLLTDKKLPRAALTLRFMIPALTAVSVTWNILYGFAPGLRAFPQEFLDRMNSAEFHARATDNEVAAVAETGGWDAHDFFRYSGRNLNWNAALGSGLSSTQFAFSFANGVVGDYFRMIGMNEQLNYAYYALDDRMIASGLAGVRYYSLAYDNYYEYRFIPYGFADLGMSGSYHLYENPCALPLGYLADTVMSRGEWEKLPLRHREEALTLATVIEDKGGELPGICREKGLHITTSEEMLDQAAAYEVPFSLTVSDGAALSENENSVTVTEAGACVTLSCTLQEGCETYLDVENLQVKSPLPIINIECSARTAEDDEFITKELPYLTPVSANYGDWHDFMINFGSSLENIEAIRIRFPEAGVYSWDRIAVVQMPMEAFPERLTALSEHRLMNIDLHENLISRATSEITGEIAAAEDAMLVLNLPYSRGFHASVDGRKTPLFKTDAMYMSLPIDAGTHDIRITYRTPGLGIGICCSFLGILILLGIMVWSGERTSPGFR